MIPVVTVVEMQAIDADASEPVDVLIARAGAAVARAAVAMLGGTYGRRVVVLAGKGNNGADGRVAAERLRRRGVRVVEVDAADAPSVLPPADLVIDAAYGTGISREFVAPDPAGATVLAVDIPSGIHGDTGVLVGRPMVADRTITFAALKPGLLLGAGPVHAGEVEVVDIGLDAGRATAYLFDRSAVREVLPERARDAHKWNAAVRIIGGSPGMPGAPSMAAAAAQRAGAGMVQIVAPGVPGSIGTVEAVSIDMDETSWAEAMLADEERIGATVVGPGLGTSMVAKHQVRMLAARSSRPVVIDGDGLTALGTDAAAVLAGRSTATVLTPHDGEFRRLAGHAPGDDRIGDVRSLAAATGSVVLAKGPTTVVADPGGAVRFVDTGDARLATAGTGDVLSGVIAALLAQGVPALDAAAAGAHVHGVAGSFCPERGTIASDVIDALPTALASIGERG